ncbi:MAG: DNA translocase FtsK [Clostridia bacterium]|nr:DNA translocase FtsK [Clostridia bacterium]
MAKTKKSEEKRALPSGAKHGDTVRKWRQGAVVVFLLLAVLMVVGFFAPNAKVLAFINKFFAWLLGPGLFALPLVFAVIAGHVLMRLNKNLRALWLGAVGCLPLLVGSIGHLFTAVFPKNDYTWSTLGKLCADGAEYTSGGLIAGGLTEILSWALSGVGAAILLFVLAAGLALVILRIPLSLIMNKASDKMEKTGEKAHEMRVTRKAERAERKRILAEQEAAEAEARKMADAEAIQRAELRARTDAKTRRIDFALDSDMPMATPANEKPDEPVFPTPDSVAKKTAAPVAVSEPEPESDNFYTVHATPAGEGKVKVPETPEPEPETDPGETPFSRLLASVEAETGISDDAEELPPWEERPDYGDSVDPGTGEVIAFPFESTPDPDDSAMVEDPDNPGTDSSRPRPTMSAEELEMAVAQAASEITDPLRGYVFPPLELLKSAPPPSRELTEAETRANQEKLIATLASFGVEARIVGVTRGPAVTRYEIQLGSGIKIARISGLSEDIALAMGAQSVRVSDIPEKFAVGIEVPNRNVETVFLRDVIEASEFADAKSGATFALGKDISGRPVVGDISRLPHVLVGGTTNSGKSVCINSLLISLIYKSSPEDLRLILIDPKMVEFASYNGIPHLLIPVVTDYKKAAGALQWAVMEMEERYKRFNGFGFRNFAEYNEAVDRMNAENEGNPEAQHLEKLPRIIIVIDELADLMMTSPKEVEASICRLAQKARAAGMNLVVATQRPSADVIKGTMKANIPSRIAFSVASSLESRIILDRNGAETLLGRGDMLFLPIGATKPRRVQGCFVSSPEIESVVAFIKNGVEVTYSEEIMRQIDRAADGGGSDGDEDPDEERDELFEEAVSFCLGTNQCSATMLQRKLKVGFARAARIVDQMEACGIVGPSEGAKSRKLLISREDWQEMQYRRSSDY